MLLLSIITEYIVNNFHLQKALNSNINCKEINSLESLPESENSSKDTILLQSNIRSNKIP